MTGTPNGNPDARMPPDGSVERWEGGHGGAAWVARGYRGAMIRGRATPTLLLTLVLVSTIGCTDVREHRDEAVDAVEQMSERGRFCLSLARAVTAIESASPDTAREAIEEAVTQAPDDLLDDVRALADAVRAAEDQGADGLRDPQVQEAARALRERTQELCDPV